MSSPFRRALAATKPRGLFYYSTSAASAASVAASVAPSAFAPAKPSEPISKVALISKLRKDTSAPLNKIKEALSQHNYNYNEALKYLTTDQASVAKASLKLADRATGEGLVAFHISSQSSSNSNSNSIPLHLNASLLEINCETDFVARSKEFGDIVSQIRDAHGSLTKDTPTAPTSSLINESKMEGTSWMDSIPANSAAVTLSNQFTRVIATVISLCQRPLK